MLVIGLMSGTSVDGVDAALVVITGSPPQLHWQLLEHHYLPFQSDLRAWILRCSDPAQSSVDQICQLNFKLGEIFATAAQQIIEKAGMRSDHVDLIGSHGQTIWHHPQRSQGSQGSQASTLQLGEAAVITEITGIPVISNFRPRDMAAGGQGAPMVAYADRLLFSDPIKDRAVQNIGGIANVTYLPGLNQPESLAFAFDTGPGNLLIDAAVVQVTQGRQIFDRDGQLAAQGHIHQGWLTELLQDPYFKLPPPKTTGREYFGHHYLNAILDQAQQLNLPFEDQIATLTALTAQSIAMAYQDFLPTKPVEVIVSGGGAHNPVLLNQLQHCLDPSVVISSGQLGIPVGAKESLAFAILAYESWHHRSNNLPSATGARHPVILGQFTPLTRRPKAPSQADTLDTEARNSATTQIDRVSTLDMVALFNAEDTKVAQAVAREQVAIAAAIDAIAERMQQGGRLIYLGAGTSGRLGVLDAAECPPTFSTHPDQVIALIAGGATAITQAVEGAEDNRVAGATDLLNLSLSRLDSVVGIAASGSTPYVLGGLEAAYQQGCLVVSLACNRPSALEAVATISIAPLVGPEVIMGSTRLKAGTAQKLVLNQLSTGVMIRLGKTFGNLMVDLQATNSKLKRRSRQILELACNLSPESAQELLERCHGKVKVAIVTHHLNLTPTAAQAVLDQANGVIAQALITTQ